MTIVEAYGGRLAIEATMEPPITDLLPLNVTTFGERIAGGETSGG